MGGVGPDGGDVVCRSGRAALWCGLVGAGVGDSV